MCTRTRWLLRQLWRAHVRKRRGPHVVDTLQWRCVFCLIPLGGGRGSESTDIRCRGWVTRLHVTHSVGSKCRVSSVRSERALKVTDGKIHAIRSIRIVLFVLMLSVWFGGCINWMLGCRSRHHGRICRKHRDRAIGTKMIAVMRKHMVLMRISPGS